MSKRTDYENHVQTFRYDGGRVRVGSSCQLIDVETHRTVASSNEAHAFIAARVHPADRADLYRLTYPPTAKPSPLNDIHTRKDSRPRGLKPTQSFEWLGDDE